VDCAALIRYAYREALRNHDSTWAAGAHLPVILPYPSVTKYQYPHTPTGPSLFRVDETSYAQFADVKTLKRFNTRFVSRDVKRAQPGDLLFYRNNDGFHSMIFIGTSHFSPPGIAYVVYHTGPKQGEIRRPSLPELLHHPEDQWRPLESNSTFLGVFRWNIL
jgi:uncharacterized protein